MVKDPQPAQDTEQKSQSLQRKILSPVKPLPYQTANPLRIKNISRQVPSKTHENEDLTLMVDSTNKKTTTTENSNSTGQEKITLSPTNNVSLASKSPYLNNQIHKFPLNGRLQIPQYYNNNSKPKNNYVN